MKMTPQFTLTLDENLSLIDFTLKWSVFFKKFTLTPGPFFIHLSLGGGKEIHLADLNQHPLLLDKSAIKHIYSHWQTYQAYYSPLQSEALLFYV